MHYSQAGGGGPQGVARRAGTAAAGFKVLTVLGLGVGVAPPSGTPAQLAAVRHALARVGGEHGGDRHRPRRSQPRSRAATPSMPPRS